MACGLAHTSKFAHAFSVQIRSKWYSREERILPLFYKTLQELLRYKLLTINASSTEVQKMCYLQLYNKAYLILDCSPHFIRDYYCCNNPSVGKKCLSLFHWLLSGVRTCCFLVSACQFEHSRSHSKWKGLPRVPLLVSSTMCILPKKNLSKILVLVLLSSSYFPVMENCASILY